MMFYESLSKDDGELQKEVSEIKEDIEKIDIPFYTPLIKFISKPCSKKLEMVYHLFKQKEGSFRELKKVSEDYVSEMRFLIGSYEDLKDEHKRPAGFIFSIYDFSPEEFLSDQSNYNQLMEETVRDKKFQRNLYADSKLSTGECESILRNIFEIGNLEKKFAEKLIADIPNWNPFDSLQK